MFQKTEAVTIHTKLQIHLSTLTVVQAPLIYKIRDNDAAMENSFERHYEAKSIITLLHMVHWTDY